MRTVRIDRVRIRLSGISLEKARSMADGLGESLLRQLAGISDIQRQKRIHIGQIDAGATQPSSKDASGADLRQQITMQIAKAVRQARSSDRLEEE